MADIVGYTDAKKTDGTPIPQPWHDNGDDTFSPVGYVESGSTTAATIADGADVTQGAKADAAASSDTGTFSEIALLKRLLSVKLPASLGQKAKAASLPVVLASDQDALAVTVASLPLPATAATAANQTSGNTSLASLDAKTPVLGAAAAAASTPVTLANDGVFATNFGLQADAAASSDTGTFSFIALFKRLLQRFVVDSTDRIRVSLYGKASAAGDTAILLTAAGRQLIACGGTLGVTGAGSPASVVDSSDASRPLGVVIYGYNGTNNDALRTPNVFKTATATASGDTALWTPASGKKFRVLYYSIEITADAATSGGGVIDIVLRDATTAIGQGFSVFVPAVAGTAFGNSVSTGWRTIGNGYFSTTANNVLNVNLSAALTSGKVRVNTAGTEE